MVYRVGDLYRSNSRALVRDTHTWVLAPSDPFHEGLVGRVRDAWAVLTGKAYAFEWPKSGDLEKSLVPPTYTNKAARHESKEVTNG